MLLSFHSAIVCSPAFRSVFESYSFWFTSISVCFTLHISDVSNIDQGGPGHLRPNSHEAFVSKPLSLHQSTARLSWQLQTNGFPGKTSTLKNLSGLNTPKTGVVNSLFASRSEERCCCDLESLSSCKDLNLLFVRSKICSCVRLQKMRNSSTRGNRYSCSSTADLEQSWARWLPAFKLCVSKKKIFNFLWASLELFRSPGSQSNVCAIESFDVVRVSVSLRERRWRFSASSNTVHSSNKHEPFPPSHTNHGPEINK